MGHDVTIIGARDPGRHEVTKSFIEETPGIDRVSVEYLDPLKGGVGALLRPGACDDALDRMGPFDIVHLHGLWTPLIVRGGAWSRKNAVPYVLCPHGMLDYWVMTQRALKKKVALATTHRALVRNAASIHVLNEHEKSAIGRFDFGVRMDVIPNGVYIEEVDIETEPGEFRRSIDGLGDAPYVLFLSRLHYKKGLDILADAWAMVAGEFPRTKLVIAGPRGDDSIDDFTASDRESGCGGERARRRPGVRFGEDLRLP